MDLLDQGSDTNTPLIDPNKNYFEELVGEGKKFKTEADLARAKMHSDIYIKTLETKLDESNEMARRALDESKAQAKLQELIDRLENRSDSQNQQITPAQAADNKPSFNPDELDTIISTKLTQVEKQRKETENWNQVQKKLKEEFGENSAHELKTRMDTLGLNSEDVNSLAKRSPTAFFNTFGLNKQQNDSFQSPIASSRRSDPFAPKTPKRTWMYYQELKKTNPSLYLDPKTNVQMQKDIVEYGDAFMDGDFAR